MRSRRGIGLPSTVMRSRAVTLTAGEAIGLAVDGDAAGRDPLLGIAARAQAGARHHLGDAVAVIFGGGGGSRRSGLAGSGARCFGPVVSWFRPVVLWGAGHLSR